MASPSHIPAITGRRPRVVIVGYGSAGRNFHGYLIGLEPRLELRGVVSRSPETRAKITADLPAAIAYDSLEAALADDEVDAVVLATPHDTHCPYALAALAAGKHVITDKPMCLSLAECRAMYAAADRAGRHLMVFHNRRWDSDFLTLRHAIAAGLLGPAGSVRHIEMGWNRFGTWKSWRARAAAGGGRLYDLGAHLLDQLLLLFPERVASVYARAHFDFPDTDTPSHCTVTLAFEGGATGVLDVTSMTRYEKPRVLAIGPEATFVKFGVDPQEGAMLARDIDAAVMPPEQWPELLTKDGPRMLAPIPGWWRGFYENVADVLTGRAEPAVRRGEMLRLFAAMDAAHESIRTGQVCVPEVGYEGCLGAPHSS